MCAGPGSCAQARRRGSIQMSARRLDHRRPFRDFGLNVGGELLRRIADDIDAELFERMPHIRIVERRNAARCSARDDRRGVPAGATRPCQVVASKPLSPSSSTVANIRQDRVRLSVVTASGRTSPLLMWPTTEMRSRTSSAPVRRSRPAAPAPRPCRATWTMSMPASVLNSSPARCAAAP